MGWRISNRFLFAAIFVSGCSALTYQLIWVRLLGLVFGVSSFAVATVVGVFLLGLGLGSYFFGKWSEHAKDPLRIYALVELGIAVFSVVSYLIIDRLPVYQYVYEYAYNNLDLYGLSLMRLVLSTLVLLPPVFLIGGTMPLIAKYFLTAPQTFGSNFSKLYYLNTLGACAGVLLTYMLIVLFLTGFISLSYEMLWVRILSTYGLSTRPCSWGFSFHWACASMRGMFIGSASRQGTSFLDPGLRQPQGGPGTGRDSDEGHHDQPTSRQPKREFVATRGVPKRSKQEHVVGQRREMQRDRQTGGRTLGDRGQRQHGRDKVDERADADDVSPEQLR